MACCLPAPFAPKAASHHPLLLLLPPTPHLGATQSLRNIIQIQQSTAKEKSTAAGTDARHKQRKQHAGDPCSTNHITILRRVPNASYSLDRGHDQRSAYLFGNIKGRWPRSTMTDHENSLSYGGATTGQLVLYLFSGSA